MDQYGGQQSGGGYGQPGNYTQQQQQQGGGYAYGSAASYGQSQQSGASQPQHYTQQGYSQQGYGQQQDPTGASGAAVPYGGSTTPGSPPQATYSQSTGKQDSYSGAGATGAAGGSAQQYGSQYGGGYGQAGGGAAGGQGTTTPSGTTAYAQQPAYGSYSSQSAPSSSYPGKGDYAGTAYGAQGTQSLPGQSAGGYTASGSGFSPDASKYGSTAPSQQGYGGGKPSEYGSTAAAPAYGSKGTEYAGGSASGGSPYRKVEQFGSHGYSRMSEYDGGPQGADRAPPYGSQFSQQESPYQDAQRMDQQEPRHLADKQSGQQPPMRQQQHAQPGAHGPPAQRGGRDFGGTGRGGGAAGGGGRGDVYTAAAYGAGRGQEGGGRGGSYGGRGPGGSYGSQGGPGPQGGYGGRSYPIGGQQPGGGGYGFGQQGGSYGQGGYQGGMGGRDSYGGGGGGPPFRQRDEGFGMGGRGRFDDRRRDDRPVGRPDRFRDDDRRPPPRDRDGGRDRDRDHRDDRRPGRSPPRAARSPPRRESRRPESPRRDARHSPPREKRREYICKVEPFTFVEGVKDYQSVSRRYTKLALAPEFCKLVACWVGKDVNIPLDKPISFEHATVDVVEDDGESKEAASKTSSAPKAARGATIWNAKVMLMSGLDDAAIKELTSDKIGEENPVHLHNLLKFVVVRWDRNPITSIGGVWDEKLDGGDPSVDDSALKRTVLRCTKDVTALDLSPCTTWNRFVEIHYERMGDDGYVHHKEITVIYLVDIWACLPPLDIYQAQWKERRLALKAAEAKEKAEGDGKEEGKTEKAGEAGKDDAEKESKKSDEMETDGKAKEEEQEEPLPTQSAVTIITKRTKAAKMKSTTISLDGLLDYDEGDREEATFELSLFAESFNEMLQLKYGSTVWDAVQEFKEQAVQRKKEERKRKKEEEKKRDEDREKRRREREESEKKEKDRDEEPKGKDEEYDGDADDGPAKKKPKTEAEADAAPKTNGSASKDAKMETEEVVVKAEEERPREGDGQAEGEDKEKLHAKEEKEKVSVKKVTVVNKDMLAAFRYFDRNRVGYLKSEDLRRILLCLGNFLSLKRVKDTVIIVANDTNKGRDDRVMYRSITDTEREEKAAEKIEA